MLWDTVTPPHFGKQRLLISLISRQHPRAALMMLRMEMKSWAEEVSVCDTGAGGLREDIHDGMYHWRSCDLCGLWAPNYSAQHFHQPVRSPQSGVLV